MDSKEIIVVIISALAAGILAPMITRWVLKWQKQKRLKLLKIPLPRLFQRRAIAAGKQQTQEIRKIPRQRVDIVGRNIHRADGKHHFAKPANQAKVNSIHSSPANDFGPLGGAKIGLVPGTPFQPQGSQIDAIL